MKILIIGSGAIGSFIGGVLAQSGQDVTFYDMPAVVEKIVESGIRVEGLEREVFINNPKALSVIWGSSETVESSDIIHSSGFSESAGDKFDLAIICVKSYNTKDVISHIPDDIASWVLTFQNGIGNEEILAEKFGKQRILSGTITYPVAYSELGCVKIENLKGGLGLAAMSGKVDLPAIFLNAGLNVKVYDDYRSMKWSKLMLNIVCNATCAILRMTPGEVFSDRRLVWIERESVLELLKVMKKKKIPLVDLPGYPVKLMKMVYSTLPASLLKMVLGRRIAKSRGDKKPSLLIEVERGAKVTEVGFYNGAIADAAESLGIPAPVNRTLCEILNKITKGEIDSDDFKGKPDKLFNLCKSC